MDTWNGYTWNGYLVAHPIDSVPGTFRERSRVNLRPQLGMSHSFIPNAHPNLGRSALKWSHDWTMKSLWLGHVHLLFGGKLVKINDGNL